MSLAVTGAGTISGTLSDGTVFSGTAPTITVSVNPSVTTTYTIATLTNGTCTSIAADRTGNATVTVNARPTGALSGTTSICNGGSTNLIITATGAGTISGTLSNGTVFSGTAPTITVSVNPTVTTIYTIATLANGTCTSIAADKTGSATVTVNARPTGALGGTTSICNGGSTNLTVTATGAGIISGTLSDGTAFSGTAPTITVSISPATTTTYTIATLTNGCVSIGTDKTGSATVTVNSPPSATINYSASPYCYSGGTASVTRTGTAGGNYSSTAGLSITAGTGDINLASSTPGSYTVTYTVAASGGCSVFTTTATVQVTGGISNNQLDFTNGSHGVLCATPAENETASLATPAGTVFINVGFASYGTPNGACNSFTINNSCNAATSQSVVEGFMLGNSTAVIPATNAVFTDPCVGTVKRLYVQATYTQPICSGTSPGPISGTIPTGGNGVYTYYWEQSSTSSSTGFTAASGINNTINYSPGNLTQTTWYRRTVTSGGCSNLSTVIQVSVIALPTAPTITPTGSTTFLRRRKCNTDFKCGNNLLMVNRSNNGQHQPDNGWKLFSKNNQCQRLPECFISSNHSNG